MNDEGRKVRFNVIDAAVIVVVIIAALAAFWFFKIRPNQGAANAQANPCRVVFTIEWTWQDDSFAEAVRDAAKRGDIIKDSVKGFYLGKAYNVEIKPDKVISFDSIDGKYLETVSPGKHSVYLSVIGDGVETPDKLTCEGQIVRVGQKVSAKGKGYAGVGYVTELYALPKEDR